MPRTSAGILLYRSEAEGLEVLLVHPGGPLWAHRDAGAWSIPKGELEPGEDLERAARREFAEELGVHAPDGDALTLGEVRLKSGKRVVAFGLHGDLDPSAIASNAATIEWPPRSGRTLEVPEVDRAAWFAPQAARAALNPAQAPFVDRLRRAIGEP